MDSRTLRGKLPVLFTAVHFYLRSFLIRNDVFPVPEKFFAPYGYIRIFIDLFEFPEFVTPQSKLPAVFIDLMSQFL